MFNRSTLVMLAAAGITVSLAAGCMSNKPEEGKSCMCGGEKHEKMKEDEHEQDIAIDQLPPAVTTTVMKEVPDGKITGAETEMKKGMKLYEVDVKGSAAAYDIKTKDDGTFVSKKVDDDEKDEHDEKK